MPSLNPVDDVTVSRIIARREMADVGTRVQEAVGDVEARVRGLVIPRYRAGRKLVAADVFEIARSFDEFCSRSGMLGIRKHDVQPTRARPEAAAIERVGIYIHSDSRERVYFPVICELSVSRRSVSLSQNALPFAWTVHASERLYCRSGDEVPSTKALGRAALANLVLTSSFAATAMACGITRIAVPAEHGLLLGHAVALDSMPANVRIRTAYDGGGWRRDEGKGCVGLPVLPTDKRASMAGFVAKTYVGPRELQQTQHDFIDAWHDLAEKHSRFLSIAAGSIAGLPSERKRGTTPTFEDEADWSRCATALTDDIRAMVEDPAMAPIFVSNEFLAPSFR